jgi:hypothetical protein
VCLHAKIDVRWLVIRRTDDGSTADSADYSALLFPDDDAATGNIALIRYGSDFINGHESSNILLANNTSRPWKWRDYRKLGTVRLSHPSQSLLEDADAAGVVAAHVSERS